jgi:hypothetical protein
MKRFNRLIVPAIVFGAFVTPTQGVALSCDSYSMLIAKAQVEMRQAGENYDRKASCDAARDAHRWVVAAIRDDCLLTNAPDAIAGDVPFAAKSPSVTAPRSRVV